MNDRPLIGITMGDPSGIGPEVVAGALRQSSLYEGMRPFILGTVKDMRRSLDVVGADDRVVAIEDPTQAAGKPGVIEVLSTGGFEDTVFPVGELSANSGAASHHWVETAAKMCLAGEIAAMVTAPVNKEAWQISGSQDLGHQEVFKRLTNAQTVYTMLVSGKLRCMHLSTHKSLIEACKFVTKENILTAARITDTAFKDWGFKSPRIAVAALNPHASDNGLIGDTEAKEIRPAVEAAVAEGINATGPHPADSVFNQMLGDRFDVVLVMYHDQGHIAIKVHGFEESISVNLGIPFIRTSVDHGTAFDIAGQNKADATSMVEAMRQGAALAARKGIA
jgi:4-hydroxythreonine-4-phosphate dehydrogenase